jgi:hypothetical protein
VLSASRSSGPPMILGQEVAGTVARAALDGREPEEGTRRRSTRQHLGLSPGRTISTVPRRFRTPRVHSSSTPYGPAGCLRQLPQHCHRRAALIEPTSVAWHAVARRVRCAADRRWSLESARSGHCRLPSSPGPATVRSQLSIFTSLHWPWLERSELLTCSGPPK